MTRKIFFWLHLIAGTVAGIVILIMSVTGVLLTYEKQMIPWLDGYRADPPAAGASRLPVGTLIAKAREGRANSPATLLIRSDPQAPAVASFGRELSVYVDPYSGQVLGEGSRKTRDFFRVVTEWHRYLAMQGESRDTGKAITGAANLAFLFLALSGLFIWFPRTWTWIAVRAVALFRGGLRGKARDFNWHNVIGAWCAIPLIFVIVGASVISYPWATDLVYRAAGVEPPKREPGPRRAPTPAPVVLPPIDAPLDGLDAAWSQAERQTTSWKTITVRVPSNARGPAAFTIDEGTAGQPQKRLTLTVDRKTGEVVRREAFGDLDAGRRARSWLRFVHTGEYYGLAGQTIAGIVSGGGAVLVYTGLALAWRRFFAWVRRRRSSRSQEVASAVAVGRD